MAGQRVYCAIMEARLAFVGALVANGDLENEDGQYLLVQLSAYGLKELVGGSEEVIAELRALMSE